MGNPSSLKAAKLAPLCLLAAGANVFLYFLVQETLHLPLYMDTLFTIALTFSAGLLPGIAAAILSTALTGLHYEVPETHFFVLCSITEAVLVWAFHRRMHKNEAAVGMSPYSLVTTASSLLILSLICCAAVSVLGGLIDFILFLLFSRARNQFSPEDIFKLGLLRNNVPLLWANLLSRFPINLVDRFIAVFGGYGVSRLILKISPGLSAP
jgi:hypothetical protein